MSEIACPSCGKTFDDAGGGVCPHCGAKDQRRPASPDATVPFARPGAEETLADPLSRARAAVARPEEDADAYSPHLFARYEILAELGRGGMGIVYRARDTTLGRTVALKVLIAGEDASQAEVERFFREAEASAKLRHPNIIPIHELDVFEGRHYFTMDLVEGQSLEDVLKKRDMDPFRAMRFMERIARAVHHAHTEGVIHRDLKPSNVIVRADGEPMVMDFGLAKQIRADSSLTQSGIFVGTPSYASPEQAEGRSREVDARSDIFSLGSMLYEMLTGRVPFLAESAFAILRKITDIDPPLPRRVDRRVPRDAEVICLKCLEKDPERRYQSAEALADDCRRFLANDPIGARPASILYRARKKVANHRGVAMALAALVLVGGVFGGWLAWEHHRQLAGWTLVYEQDFAGPDASLEGLEFYKADLKGRAEPFVLGAGGLETRWSEWCWLRDARVRGDVRLVLRVRHGPGPDLEGCVNTRIDPVSEIWAVPPGYSFQFGGYGGRLDFISRNEGGRWGDSGNSVPSAARPGTMRTVAFERRGDRISLSVDGVEVHGDTDPLPLQGAGLDRVGFRVFQEGVTVVSLAVYRLSLPEKASPLVAGDSLVEAGHLAEAVARYRTIAEDRAGTAVAELALARACLAAIRLPGEAGGRAKEDARRELEEKHPRSRYLAKVIEADALATWREGRHAEALGMLPRVFELDPGTRVALRLLRDAPRPPPKGVAAELVSWVARTRGADCLDLNRLGLTTLDPLAGMRLTWLACEGNSITSLEPLRGMKLTWLKCAVNRITGLEPLQGMPLQSLYCDSNQLTSLEPMRGMPLECLHCTGNEIRSLEPLRGMALTSLGCGDNRITSLGPVRGMPLGWVLCQGNEIETLEPLRGMPLTSLWCFDNRISSLEPLHGLETLELLNCDDNQIGSLEPLRGLTALTSLNCGRNRIVSLEPLQAAKTLSRLCCWDNRIESLEPLSGLTALTALNCSGNRITNLEPLGGLAALTSLDCSGNRIESLESLRGLTALSSLHCRGNRIDSLEPVRGLAALTSLDCSGNRIDSLEPLRGLTALTSLDCNGNRIESLEPFVTEREPPESFFFDCETLPEAELVRAREAWSKDPVLAANVRETDVTMALRRRDTAALRGLAREFRGHRYLFMGRDVRWDEAKTLSERAGGHLVTIRDEEENLFVLNLPTAWTWLGATDRDAEGEWRWVTDEAWAWTNWGAGEPNRRTGREDCLVIRDDGRWNDEAGNSLRPFVIEWDD